MGAMENRSNILACALKLFADKGYDAVGVQEIVDAAGITKPTLYHYFGSKEGLLEALLGESFTSLNQKVKAAAHYTGDLPQTLFNVTEAFFQFARENPTFYRLQLALWFSPRYSDTHRVVAKWNNEQYQIVEQLFVLAVKNHGNMAGRHRAYATSFIGVINTYIGLALNEYTELNADLARQAVHQFQHGIYS